MVEDAISLHEMKKWSDSGAGVSKISAKRSESEGSMPNSISRHEIATSKIDSA